MAQISWERKEGKNTHFIVVDHLKVTIGIEGEQRYVGGAASCSYTKFLAGRFHTQISNTFNEKILNEVIASVKNAENNPVFAKERRKIHPLQNALSTIPLDATLAGWVGHSDLERGSKNYGNAGHYKTILRSDTLTMTVEKQKGFLVPNQGGEKIDFTLSGNGFAASAIAYQDYFYLVFGSDYAIISPNGKVLKKELDIFGETLRINSVFQGDNVVFYAYSWFQSEYPRGWLRYEIGEGFTGRWVELV